MLATFFDFKTKNVPNFIPYFGILFSLISNAIFEERYSFIFALSGGILGFSIFYYPYHKGILGAGDVKLFAMMGTFLELKKALWAYEFSILSGGIVAIIILLWRGKLVELLKRSTKSGENELDFPYAVCIFLGAFLSLSNLQGFIN